MRKLPPPYVDRQATEVLADLLLNKFGRSYVFPNEFKIVACGWAQEESDWGHLESGEEPSWIFYIATPDYDKHGPKEMYKMLHLYLDNLAAPANRISRQDIRIEKYNPNEEYQFKNEKAI